VESIINNLPEKYFDTSNNRELFEEIDGGEIDLDTFDPITLSEDYSMANENSDAVSNTASSVKTVSKENDNAGITSSNKVEIENEAIDPNNSDISGILSEIEKIDKKIANLEGSLYRESSPIETGEVVPELRDGENDKDGIVSVVNNNFFDGNNTSKRVENSNNVEVDNFNEMFGSESKNFANSQESIFNSITELKNIKENLLNKIYYGNSDNTKTENNQTQSTNSTVTVDNFTPNFADIDSSLNESLEKSYATENIFGEKPKLVTDSKGTPAFISEDQVDLKSALEDHGGFKDAIKDSINQQTFVTNLANSEEIFSSPEAGSDFTNQSNYKSFSENYMIDSTESSQLPTNDSLDIIKNTGETVAVLKALTKEFNNLSNAITSGFNSINGKIRDIKISQSFSDNSTSTQYGNNMNVNNRSSRGEKSLIPSDIRGNTPLSEHFPGGFNLESLGGSNLAYRI